MTLKDLLNKSLVLSGQFLMTSVNIEVNIDNFKDLVKVVLSAYNKYRPFDRTFNINTEQKYYTFINDIPDMIGEITPVRFAGVPLWYFQDKFTFNLLRPNFIWSYRKPTLYLPWQGIYDVNAVYNQTIIQQEVDGVEEWVLPYITDEDNLFIDMVVGKFMYALGRSRQAFVLNDVPITTDAAQLISDGNEMYNNALANLVDNQAKIWLAYK